MAPPESKVDLYAAIRRDARVGMSYLTLMREHGVGFHTAKRRWSRCGRRAAQLWMQVMRSWTKDGCPTAGCLSSVDRTDDDSAPKGCSCP
ncbi:hypothetical protein GCM10010307_81490 [Streptomyces vastus]|uniref:Transposase n=1 Tax=Streptomyces vastus TaxID=285451 RepID=A0ABN3RWA9_9ACTN